LAVTGCPKEDKGPATGQGSENRSRSEHPDEALSQVPVRQAKASFRPPERAYGPYWVGVLPDNHTVVCTGTGVDANGKVYVWDSKTGQHRSFTGR